MKNQAENELKILIGKVEKLEDFDYTIYDQINLYA